MPSVSAVTLELLDRDGSSHRQVVISLLPKSSIAIVPSPLLDARGELEIDPSVEPVQLLEAEEYRFQLHGFEGGDHVSTDRPEIFEPDDEFGQAGRLRPGMYIGTLPVNFSSNERPAGRISIEIRSRKLNYQSHYRWMLRDIADKATELLMERFAPTEQKFAPEEKVASQTAYQRFAFLRTFIESDTFRAAIARIIQRPYVQWSEKHELRPPNQGLRSSSSVLRQLTRPGPRLATERPISSALLSSLPRMIEVKRAEETLDNVPNRFVKFVLERWCVELAEIERLLSSQDVSTAPVERGLREVRSTRTMLDELLSQELFREVGVLTFLPAANPTLLGREGYRDILDAHLRFDLAARLSWVGGEDVYRAGQRDVATLYEYWVFLKLAEIVSELCQESLNLDTLIERSDDGLNLNLRRGKERRIWGTTTRFGRRLEVSFWFNRQFSRGTSPGSSWTRALRPDFSLEVRYLDAAPLDADRVWIHFDAKYRIEKVEEILAGDEETFRPNTQDEGPRATAKRTDLLKMHAYRDAIRRSAGAYVIYPGDKPKSFQEYHEVLPGLGAFGLRPSEQGASIGAGRILRFIEDVISHAAAQVSQHERSRFWERRVYEGPPPANQEQAFAPFLEQPPADTKVLLGYVKSRAHLEWIRTQGRYNLRADEGRRGRVELDSKSLGADLILLYGSQFAKTELWKITGRPEIANRAGLIRTGYPSPRGESYFCLVIEPVRPYSWIPELTSDRVLRIRERLAPGEVLGAPVVVSWLDLADA